MITSFLAHSSNSYYVCTSVPLCGTMRVSRSCAYHGAHSFNSKCTPPGKTLSRQKVIKKLNTHILFPATLCRKSCLLWDNVKKQYDIARPVTDGSITGRKRFTCRVTKARWQTHTHNMLILLFHSKGGYAQVPQCYVFMFICLSC